MKPSEHVTAAALQRYATGGAGIGADALWAVEAHLERCVFCRARLSEAVARRSPETMALLASVQANLAIEVGRSPRMPIAWPPRRAAHVILAGGAVLGLLGATALVGQQMGATGQLARNVAGLTGLVALGAVGLGAARAPLLPVMWTVVVLWWAPPLGEPPTRPTYKVTLTWMVQPAEIQAATVAAVVLAAVGILAYAVLGSRR
jgi:hypothetical protein